MGYADATVAIAHEPDAPPSEWTFFVFLNADNDLERAGMQNLEELIPPIGSRMNVLALVDGWKNTAGSTWSGAPSGWSTGTRLLVLSRDAAGNPVKKDVPLDGTSELGRLLQAGNGELNTGDPKVLRAALQHVRDQLPKSRLIVDLWDHGRGWKDFSVDFSSNNSTIGIANGEFNQAVDGFAPDVVLFDACLMSTFEVALATRRAGSKFMVASEELVPGKGLDYFDAHSRVKQRMDLSCDMTAGDVANIYVNSYVSQGDPYYVAVTCTDLQKLPSVEQSLAAFSSAILQGGGVDGNPALRACYDDTLRFKAGEAETFDLGDFTRRVAQRFPEGPLSQSARALFQAIDDATEVRHANHAPVRYRDATGLAIYAPRSWVSAEYRSPSAPWSGSPWIQVIEGVAKPPIPRAIPAWAQPRY